ncbi:hypothetical protein BDR22DRAFT_876291 [Usnea florida]
MGVGGAVRKWRWERGGDGVAVERITLLFRRESVWNLEGAGICACGFMHAVEM